MPEEQFLNEFKISNKELMTFLSNEKMTKILNYILIESTSNEKVAKFKYPKTAESILSCSNERVENYFKFKNDEDNYPNFDRLFLTLANASTILSTEPVNFTRMGYVLTIVTNLLKEQP